MEASHRWEWKHAYVLRADDLKGIWKLLDDRLGNVSATLTCANDLTLKVEKIQQLLEYENAPDRRVVSMSMHARSDTARTAWLYFYENRITVSLDGRTDLVDRLSDDIKKLLATTRPWYARLAKVDYFDLLFLLYIGSWLTIFVLANLGVFGSSKPADPAKSRMNPDLVVFGIGAMFMTAGWGLNRFNRSLFPRSAFVLGHEVKQYAFWENVRWVVVIGLVVSIAGSAIVALFT